MGNRTFTIIKPNAVADGNTGKILDIILENGFVIKGMKMVFLSRNDAARFYAIHNDKPFFGELVDFMSSGAAIVAVLERENAVAELRKLVGNTDPQKAEKGTIRQLFATEISRNAIHASDSDENAQIEWSQFFCPSEIVEIDYCIE